MKDFEKAERDLKAAEELEPKGMQVWFVEMTKKNSTEYSICHIDIAQRGGPTPA